MLKYHFILFIFIKIQMNFSLQLLIKIHLSTFLFRITTKKHSFLMNNG